MIDDRCKSKTLRKYATIKIGLTSCLSLESSEIRELHYISFVYFVRQKTSKKTNIHLV